MAYLGDEGFRAHLVAPVEPIDVMSPGRYAMAATRSDWHSETTLRVHFEVHGGAHDGTSLVELFAIRDEHDACRASARAAFASLCRAAGVDWARDSAQLHRVPIVAEIGVVRQPSGQELNVVESYHRRGALRTDRGDGAGEADVDRAPWARGLRRLPGSHPLPQQENQP